jgi:hypothetical protein
VGSAPNIRRTSVNGPSLALQSRLQRLGDAHRSPHLTPPKCRLDRLAASHELLELPSASSTSGPRPASHARSKVAEASPSLARWPVPRRVPSLRYSARRTRTLHSDPKVRALSPNSPGFSPVARLACRVVLRSCFRPGTRLGLPRLPPLATLHPAETRSRVRQVRSEDLSLRLPVGAFQLDAPREECLVFRPGGSALPRPF